MQKIIAFSREFGSGGHEIAERIAKACNLAFYDRNLLDEIAKEKEYNKRHVIRLYTEAVNSIALP